MKWSPPRAAARPAAEQGGASEKFTRSFTENYAELAEVAPVYAQLRNCIDLLGGRGVHRQARLVRQAGVTLGALGDETAFPVETLQRAQAGRHGRQQHVEARHV